MRTTHPPERLAFNDWFIYIQKEIIKDRQNKLRIYEQNIISEESIREDRSRDRRSTRGIEGAETIDFVEIKDDQRGNV